MKNLLRCTAILAAAILAIGFGSCKAESDEDHGAIPTYYKVTFNSNGGTDVNEQTVPSGKKATKPADPTKSATETVAYVLAGWYETEDFSGEAFDFNTAITKNITLYAKWTETVSYRITVTDGTADPKLAASGTIVTITAGTAPEGKVFDKWMSETAGVTFTDAEASSTTFTMPGNDVVITANYVPSEAIPLTLEFITSGKISVTNPWSTLKYTKNDGEMTNYTGAITVAAGDRVCLYAKDSENTVGKGMTISCTSDCYVYGNIMSLVSLIDTDSWKTDAMELSTPYAFYELFSGNVYIKNHESKAIVLPATTLAKSCYYDMFYNCTGLTAAPELPAGTLAESCYAYMFQNCARLTSAPALPATELAEGCYKSMFSGCTGLTTAPELPATILVEDCYESMFSGCTELTTAPELPAKTLAKYCYASMLEECTGLTAAPELPATTLAEGCYESMFYGCTGLTTAPELPAETLDVECYYGMFEDCTGLTKAPDLPASTLADGCYEQMFYGCTALAAAPELNAENLADSCYADMFKNCIGLTSAPALPATILKEYCYYGMFNGCTALTKAPVLPAETLVKYCYYGMFYNCSNLNYIKCLATDISALDCTTSWVATVASSGTFVKADSMTSWSTSIAGIPEGWTVKNVSSENN